MRRILIALFLFPIITAGNFPHSSGCFPPTVGGQGGSLSPPFHYGVAVLMRPASCVAVIGRGALAVFRTGARQRPVIKIVRAVPGDRFAVDAEGALIVNNKGLKNSAGVPYALPPAARRMLESYVRAYNGIIPADTYLLLGDGRQGLIDSTRLGLIHRSDFVMVGKP